MILITSASGENVTSCYAWGTKRLTFRFDWFASGFFSIKNTVKTEILLDSFPVPLEYYPDMLER